MKIQQEIKKWKNFMFSCIALAIFFGLEYFHDWANTTLVKLHFCEHLYCMIFAAIFLVIAFMSWKKKKHYLKIGLIILGVGLILMNVTNCENGEMFLGNFSFGTFFTHTSYECKPGVDCPGDIVEVPIPPCEDTDGGRDYITPGMILSGADLADRCMGSSILRERYCYDELRYTSEDINCLDVYGDGWICEGGECIFGDGGGVGDGSSDCVDLDGDGYDNCDFGDIGDDRFAEDCDDTDYGINPGVAENCGDGIDNDCDDNIDCADSDCTDDCGIFDYSCQHLSPYPTCGGTCPSGEECIPYIFADPTLDGWCECMPSNETPCGQSCGGWCLDVDKCVSDPDGECYCDSDIGNPCYENDGGNTPLIPGWCYDEIDGEFYYDTCSSGSTVNEYVCEETGCEVYGMDCSVYGNYFCEFNKFGGDYCFSGEY